MDEVRHSGNEQAVANASGMDPKSRPMVLQNGGVLAGVRLGPRDAARGLHDEGFRDEDIAIGVAVCGAESWLFTHAYNDNKDKDGKVVSRDVGLMQINIPASDIGTQNERDLYDPSTNFKRAMALWRERDWQPWVSWNTGVFLHDTYMAWGLLGAVNLFAEVMVAEARRRGQTPHLRVPFVSLPDARRLYPGVMLG